MAAGSGRLPVSLINGPLPSGYAPRFSSRVLLGHPSSSFPKKKIRMPASVARAAHAPLHAAESKYISSMDDCSRTEVKNRTKIRGTSPASLFFPLAQTSARFFRTKHALMLSSYCRSSGWPPKSGRSPL
jgi:hypothetical protein